MAMVWGAISHLKAVKDYAELRVIIEDGHENATAESGPWIITLDAPSFMAAMQHAKNRTLHEEVYRAYITRASSEDMDNTSIIDQILNVRLEKAKLLGYNNYAEVCMETKMTNVEKTGELLEKLRSASWDPAVQDCDTRMVQTSFTWRYGGRDVFLSGSFHGINFWSMAHGKLISNKYVMLMSMEQQTT